MDNHSKLAYEVSFNSFVINTKQMGAFVSYLLFSSFFSVILHELLSKMQRLIFA